MGRYFGTDGFRGEAGVTLTVEHAYKVGRFVGWYLSREKKARIVIGKDTRRSGYMFEAALVAGLTASGADAYLLHVTTTPSISYVVRTEKFDCGIMISASHNPYHDNGIKLINADGFKMDAEVEGRVEDYIDGKIPEIPFAVDDSIGKTVDYSIGRQRYIDYLTAIAMEAFGATRLSTANAKLLSGIRIGLDLCNGSATTVAKQVFSTLGAKVFVVNDAPDGVNINTNCGSTHLSAISRFVTDNGLDVGFAYDGDADRCLVVDENGKAVTGDEIMYICGSYMKELGELEGNKVVTTVMSNIGLYKALDKLKIGYEKTSVGDKYVSECMQANGYVIGGENSGHIIFGKNAVTGDGILTSIKIISVLLAKGKRISELAGEMKVYPQVLKNLRINEKGVILGDKKIRKAISESEKRLGDNGRVLVRESGTEPLIRVMVEAGTLEECEKEVDFLINMIKECGFAE